MKDEYKKQVNQIKAPKGLVEQTRQEMKQRAAQLQQQSAQPQEKTNNYDVPSNQETTSSKNVYPFKKKTNTWIRYGMLAAVAIILVGGSYTYFQSQDGVKVATLEQEADSFSLDKNFGQIGGQKDEGLEISKGSSRKVIPDFLWEVEPSKINDIEVWLGKNKDETFYAGYQKDGVYYLVKGTGFSQEKFVDYVKSRLE